MSASNGQVEAVGYNLTKYVKTNAVAAVSEEGSVVVDVKFCALVARLPSGIQLDCTVVDNVLTLRCSSGVYKFATLDASDYPELPVAENELSFEVAPAELNKVWKTIQHVPQMSVESTARPMFAGVNLEYDKNAQTFRCVASDGFRVAIADADVVASSTDVDFSSIVPSETLKFLTQLKLDENVKISQGYRDRQYISFNTNNICVVSRLIDGSYFNYRRALQMDETVEVEVDKHAFLESCERVALAISDDKSPIVLNFTPSEIKISGKSAMGLAEETLDDMKYVREPEPASSEFVIGFNQRFLSDAVKAIDDDTFVMRLSNPLAGAALEPKDRKNSSQFVLPVRLK